MGNEWGRRKREECRVKGICIQCHKRKARKNKAKCVKCAKMSSRAGGTPVTDYTMPTEIKNDITGNTINNWYVIGYSHRTKYVVADGIDTGANHFWKVKCTNCGHESTKAKSYINRSKSCGICHLKQNGTTGLNYLYSAYRCGARDKREFTLTKERFREITSSPCYYCGSPPSLMTNWGHSNKDRFNWGVYKFNGIDRKNNTEGYTNTNCVPCCKICNRAKNDMPFDEFMSYLQRVATHINNSNGEIDRTVVYNFDEEGELENSGKES